MVFTLSSISQVNPIQPFTNKGVVSKYIELLNAIALLLVSRAQGDIAAAAIVIDLNPPNGACVELIWAKNSPATSAEIDYVEQLAEVVGNLEDVNDRVHIFKTLIQHMVSFCIAKLRHRVQKLASAIDKLPQGATFQPLDQSFKVHEELREIDGMGGVSFADAFRSISPWAGQMKTRSTMEFQEERYWDIKLYYAYTFGFAAVSDESAYARLSPEEDTIIRRIRRTIPPQHPRIPGDFVQNLKDYIEGKAPGQKPLTHQDLCLLHSDLENPAGVGYKELTESIHAEISIASHFKKQSGSTKDRNDVIIPIGASKKAYFLCYHYRRSLSCNEGLKFVVLGYQRKVPATWRAPPADMDIEMVAVRAAVATALDTIIARVLRGSKSDSVELGAPTMDREEYQAEFGVNVFDDDDNEL